MEPEIWRDVKGYKGLYQISSLGNVRSLDRKVKTKQGTYTFKKSRRITIRLNNFGYLDTRLCKNGIKKSAFIHRLIAEAFIENPKNLPKVNHLNGVKTDNRICNLEWCTHAENMQHAFTTGLCKIPQKSCRKVIDTCTNQTFNSIREAATANNIHYSTCKNMLRGVRKNNTCLCLAA